MHKEFDQWNILKKKIHQEHLVKFYHAREIWWCTLGINVGHEQDGNGEYFRRPVLILKGLGTDTCIVVPLTKSTSIHPLRPSIGVVDGKDACALLSQIRVIDIRRLVRKIQYLDKETFERIRKVVRGML